MLPVVFFTKDRTRTAAEAISRLVKYLSCGGMEIVFVIADDGSMEGHLDRLEAVVHDLPHCFTQSGGSGLPASMNLGIAAALSLSDVFLRTEDDWMLEKPLDVSRWVEDVRRGPAGVVRLGMMFRDPDEFTPYPNDGSLMRLRSRPGRVCDVNNQVAIVGEQVHCLVGGYSEDLPADKAEVDFAIRFGKATDKGSLSPWVCWPKGWPLGKMDDPSLFFIHAGKSSLGHGRYAIPDRYRHLL